MHVYWRSNTPNFSNFNIVQQERFPFPNECTPIFSSIKISFHRFSKLLAALPYNVWSLCRISDGFEIEKKKKPGNILYLT